MSGGMIIIDTSGLADIVMTTNGDMIYYNAGRQRLAKGSDGQQLQLAGGFPSWVTSAGGSVTPDGVVNDYSTTIGDYDQAITTATASNDITTAYNFAHTVASPSNNWMNDVSINRLGVKFVAGFAGIGAIITSVKLKFKMGLATTGPLYCEYSSSNDCMVTANVAVGQTTLGSLNTSSFVQKTFSTNPFTIAAGDYLYVRSGWLNNNAKLSIGGGGVQPSNLETGTRQTNATCTFPTGNPLDIELDGTITRSATAAIDGSTDSYWECSAAANNWLQLDLGSNQGVTAMTIYLDTTTTTETQFLLQSSLDAVSWDDLRTINVSDLSDGSYNYIRFNPQNARYFRIYGNSGASSVIKINEVALQPLTISQHGHLVIDPSDATLALNGE